jgi:spore coat protein JC
MWIYEKKLEYPVRVAGTDLRMAKFLLAQYGGPYFLFYSAFSLPNREAGIFPEWHMRTASTGIKSAVLYNINDKLSGTVSEC